MTKSGCWVWLYHCVILTVCEVCVRLLIDNNTNSLAGGFYIQSPLKLISCSLQLRYLAPDRNLAADDKMGDSLLLWTNPGADKVSAVSNIHRAQDISVTLWRSLTSIQETLTQWGDGWQDGEESPQVSQVLIFAQHFSTMNIFKGRETSCWNICKNGPQTGWVKKAFGVQCSSNSPR